MVSTIRDGVSSSRRISVIDQPEFSDMVVKI